MKNTSSDINLFQWLVQYHYQTNLPNCLKHLAQDGVIYDCRDHPLEEGSSENPWYDGVLIFKNGETLLEKMLRDQFIADQPATFIPVKNKEDFSDYSRQRKNTDGAYIYDAKKKLLARIRKFNNNPQPETALPIHKLVEEFLPAGFVFSQHTQHTLPFPQIAENIGLKTDLAMRTVLAYDQVDAYQIKRTAHGRLGMGLVTHFGEIKEYSGPGLPKGLLESFSFEYAPESLGPFVREDYPIIGIYTCYGKEKGKIIPLSRSLLKAKDSQLVFPPEKILPEKNIPLSASCFPAQPAFD